MKYTMRERCLIDTSVLLKVILEGEVGILNKLQYPSLPLILRK